MFYRIIALALVVLGAIYIVFNLTWPLTISRFSLGTSAIGLSTIFLGLLNWVYVYETPNSKIPKVVLFASNLLFIGFAILLITSGIDATYGYSVLILSLFNCVMVLNHKV